MNNHTAFIGLGSNLNHPINQINIALQALKDSPEVSLVKCSHLYESAPMGSSAQPNYINAVCQISTKLEPEALLDLTQSIEFNQGRERTKEKWSSRTLDLDILLVDDLVLHTKRLIIPHYGISGREFVLVPLFEISPDLIMNDGRDIVQWVAECSLAGLRRIDKSSLHSKLNVSSVI